MIKVGSKCKIKHKPTKGVSFKVVAIDKYGEATIVHSVSGVNYLIPIYELELMKK